MTLALLITIGLIASSAGFVCGAMWAAMKLETVRDIDWEDAA